MNLSDTKRHPLYLCPIQNDNAIKAPAELSFSDVFGPAATTPIEHPSIIGPAPSVRSIWIRTGRSLIGDPKEIRT